MDGNGAHPRVKARVKVGTHVAHPLRGGDADDQEECVCVSVLVGWKTRDRKSVV